MAELVSSGGVRSDRASFARMERRLRVALWIGWLAAIALASVTSGSFDDFLASLGGGVLLLLAAAGIGGLGGLLFGLPKCRDEAGTGQDSPIPLRWFRPNSNLQEISDWLTKIIVGVGLIELRAIPGALEDLAEFVAPVLTEENEAVAILIGVYGIALTFVVVYLWSSVCLRQLLEGSEADIRRQLETARQRSDVQFNEPDAADAQLLRTTDRRPSTGASALQMGATGLRSLVRPQPDLDEEVARARAALAAGESLTPNYLRSLARQLVRAAQYREAVWAYDAAYQMDPTDPAPLNFAGATLGKYLHDFEQAIRKFDAALDIDPNYASAFYNKACTLARMGDNAAALENLEQAIAFDAERYRELATRDAAQPEGPFYGMRESERFKDLLEPN